MTALGYLAEADQLLHDPNATPEEIEAAVAALIDSSYEKHPSLWLPAMLPGYFPAPFAGHHDELLAWAWLIELGRRRHPFVAVWPRGGAKSTIAEAVTVMLGARRQRKYAMYVSGIQDKANDHVGNVAAMLGTRPMRKHYESMGRRAVSDYGHAKGWKRNRLRTASNYTVDAIGLDTMVRGAKLDDQRPDLIVIDDVDDPYDSPAVVRKKLDIITHSILPAGSEDLIVLVIQNLVHEEGVVAQIIDGRAEMLADRHVSGPIPAIAGAYAIVETGDTRPVEDGGTPWRIDGGEPSWAGQDRAACEATIARIGPTAWESEAQHKPRRIYGGLFDSVLENVRHCTRAEVPDLVRKSIAVDPATTDSDHSDSHGVQCDGIALDGTIYRLRSWEHRASPSEALELAITWGYEEGCYEIGVEMVGTDLSGRGVEASWNIAFENALERVLDAHPDWRSRPRVYAKRLKASSSTGSKAARGSIMLADYERPGRIVHVIGDHGALEAALGRAFVVKPFDLADAAFYSWRDLREGGIAETSISQLVSARIPTR